MGLSFDPNASSNVHFNNNADIESLSLGTFTMTVWMRPRSDLFDDTNTPRIMDKNFDSSRGFAWYCDRVSSTEGRLKFIQYVSGFLSSDGQWRGDTNFPYGATEPYILVSVRRDGTSSGNQPIFSINGVDMTTTTESSQSGTTGSDGSSAWFFAESARLARALGADLADGRAYNRVLAKQELETVYATRGADNIVTGLVMREPLNELELGAVPLPADVIDLSPTGTNCFAVEGNVDYVDGPGLKKRRRR